MSLTQDAGTGMGGAHKKGKAHLQTANWMEYRLYKQCCKGMAETAKGYKLGK